MANGVVWIRRLPGLLTTQRQPVYVLVGIHVYILAVVLFFELEPRKYTPPMPTPMPYCYTSIRTEEHAKEILERELEEYRDINPPDIPKIIHFIYRDRDIPMEYTKLIQSWHKYNPEFQFYFWDDKKGPRFVEKYYPEFSLMYNAYCHDLMRSDALRYFILHKYGGIYVDMDYECYKPIHKLINNGSKCQIVQENWAQVKLLYKKDMLVQNSWMAAAPRHPFMSFVINSLPSSAEKAFVWGCSIRGVLDATGPLVVDTSRQTYAKHCRNSHCGITVLPSNIMMPEYVLDSTKTKFERYDYFCGSDDRLRRLDKGGRQACAKFKNEKNNIPKIGPEVYASHKFLHLGNSAHGHQSLCYTDIKKLIPTIIFPEV